MTREDYFLSLTLTHTSRWPLYCGRQALLSAPPSLSLSPYLPLATQKRTEGQELLLNLLISELGCITKEKTKNLPHLSRRRTQNTALVNTDKVKKYRCSGNERKNTTFNGSLTLSFSKLSIWIRGNIQINIFIRQPPEESAFTNICNFITQLSYKDQHVLPDKQVIVSYLPAVSLSNITIVK